MNKLFTYLLLLILGANWQACNVINPKEVTPFFLDVDSAFVKNTDYSVHGSSSSKISDVWVYYNNNLLGAFELPARIPIIGDKTGIVTLQAGVLRNGLQADRLKYPFYKLKSFPLDWAAGNVKKIISEFEYLAYDDMKMYIQEDFEVGNSFTPTNTDTVVQKSNDAIYGTKCGIIYLDATHRNSDNIIEQKLDLIAGSSYYVELDYKTSVPIQINFLCTSNIGVASVQPIGGANPKANWNKMYLDLGALVSAVKAKSYNLIISTTLPNGTNSGYTYIDNVKIIGPR